MPDNAMLQLSCKFDEPEWNPYLFTHPVNELIW